MVVHGAGIKDELARIRKENARLRAEFGQILGTPKGFALSVVPTIAEISPEREAKGAYNRDRLLEFAAEYLVT